MPLSRKCGYKLHSRSECQNEFSINELSYKYWLLPHFCTWTSLPPSAVTMDLAFPVICHSHWTPPPAWRWPRYPWRCCVFMMIVYSFIVMTAVGLVMLATCLAAKSTQTNFMGSSKLFSFFFFFFNRNSCRPLASRYPLRWPPWGDWARLRKQQQQSWGGRTAGPTNNHRFDYSRATL